MLREKQFYKTFSVLALSLALHNLLSYSVNMMDSRLSPQSLPTSAHIRYYSPSR